MSPFDPVVVLLAVEVLVVVTLLGGVLFFMSKKKQGKELAEIDNFIKDMEEQATVKNRWLEQFMSENCGLPSDEIESLLLEVNTSERSLFQSVIRLLLKREMALLTEIEQRVGQISEPYQNLLSSHGVGGAASTAPASESQQTNQIAGLERINQQLVKQLDNAMTTIDEMSAEYTRVFSGNQTALELENSSKKMLQIFHDAEHGIRLSLAELSK